MRRGMPTTARAWADAGLMIVGGCERERGSTLIGAVMNILCWSREDSAAVREVSGAGPRYGASVGRLSYV